MDIKHREIAQWLKEVYGKEHVPPYEKTESSINILHHLMTASKCSEGKAKLLASDYTLKANEYNAEAKQLSKWLESVKIQEKILSPEGQKGLSALHDTAQILDIQTTTSTNIILAMNQLEMEYMQVTNEREQERERFSRFLVMSQELSHKLKEIKGIFQQAEKTSAQEEKEQKKNMRQQKFLEEKNKNYIFDISQYEAKLSKIPISKNIMHGSLVKQWTELQDLEKKVNSLENQLKSYTLPPDMSLAEVVVEEARQELAAMMAKLASVCSN
ncbi:HAUS augmin-like complex subunit 1 [Procambarus clarkii]|uniref:HAUS augmin-like complex subunit 1 n=1 Tax=Procambarus clarkii TaxID=6728 RepID=UPI001E670BA3|nr:HAUS augmin-like complex subunit 1 [Procambarus clarkii]XP_045623230.1 HAUS augmin-like complex subunit 1 [Procambarus clarkii]XP_045623231.1 HAUS augmin-like complex subunit 1 [Procambarus clarkii]XP_045623232.1 HAUS augmin-like complex subunit 1 [Procambarus clarkii]XP_045623234.1 HAUS augmin-like complex subunit 1 [Procambarus clarkii]